MMSRQGEKNMGQISSLHCGEKWTWDLQDLREVDAALQLLRKISRRLHRLHEVACNYGLSSRQERREERLEKQAEEIARKLGFQAYIQSDPRGCALYLVPLNWTEEEKSCRYSSGMAIY